MGLSSKRTLAAFAVAVGALAGMGVGCNGILGLDGYSGRTDSGVVADGGGADATDGDAEVFVPPQVRPASWPKWIMPNEPDSGADNKAAYGQADQDITVLAAPVGSLAFRVTGVKVSTFDDAVRACPVGYRLPTRIELVTLLDYRPSRASVLPDLALALSDSIWTSSIRRPATNPLRHWFVNGKTGAWVAQPPQAAAVICILGGA